MEPSLGAGDRDETTSDGAACGVTSTVEEPTRGTCATCGGVKCGNKANYTAHGLSNKHKKAAQRERGRATLAALKAKAATAS